MHGPPQVLEVQRGTVQPFHRKSDARLEAYFCSDPRPTEVYWTWDGQSVLKEGASKDRYIASGIQNNTVDRKDCYISALTIANVAPSDAKNYKLVAKNSRGQMEYAIRLKVIDPIAMATVIGMSLAVLLLIVVLTVGLAYSYRHAQL